MYMSILLFHFDNVFGGYTYKSLDFINMLCVIAAISVVISKNPVVSVLFLIGLFLGISCYLIIAGLNFIGLSYLLVYVGAVSILFLFILMLINIRISELVNNTGNVIPIALVISLSFVYFMYSLLPYNNENFYLSTVEQYWNKNVVHEFIRQDPNFYIKNGYFVSSKLWDGSIVETTQISSLGYVMYTTYFLWLMITSIILLLAMVGAIIITIKQSR